jgi:tyrosine-protein phosphatase SIW14
MDRAISTREALHEEDDLILAPENFSMVEPGVYRSAFPRAKNQAFLLRLGIKTIIPLVPEDYPAAMKEFCARHGIRLVSTCGVDGNKWPFKEIDADVLAGALHFVMHRSTGPAAAALPVPPYTYRPCLFHCNKGKHRTGSLAGCLRKLRGWGLSAIVQEYQSFAAPKPRLEDQRFIEAFDIEAFKQRLVEAETAGRAPEEAPEGAGGTAGEEVGVRDKAAEAAAVGT